MGRKRRKKDRTSAPSSPAVAAPQPIEPIPDASLSLITRWTRRPAVVYLVVAAAAVLVYLNTLPNGFVYDDITIIERNERIRTLADPAAIWLTDWWYVPPEQTEERHRDRLYRPLVIQTFALNYAVSGLNPWSYHAFNVALHVLVCVTVVSLTRRLFTSLTVAAWAGLLFAVLPVHTEAVNAVVGRADVMGALFCLLGLLCLTRELNAATTGPRRAWRLGVVTCLLLGLLSKEQAVCLPGLLVLTEWHLRRRRLVAASPGPSGSSAAFLLRRFGALYGWIILAVVAYLALRYVSLEGHLRRDVPPATMDNPLVEASAVRRLLGPFMVLGQYLLVTLWPANLSCDYSYNALPLLASPLHLTTLGGLVLVIVAVWAAWRSARRENIVLYILLFFAMTYALISNSFLIIGTIMGERLFYLPSLPLCWLAALGLRHLFSHLLRRGLLAGPGLRLAPALAYAVVLVLAVRTVVRNADWHSSDRLFAADLRIYPNSARLQLFVGRSYIERREFDLALHHLSRSIQIYPEYANAQANMGLIYALAGDWTTAKKHYALAMQLLWENPKMQLQYEQFRRFYEEGIEYPETQLEALKLEAADQPDNVDLHFRLAKLQAGLGHYRDAINTLQALVDRGHASRDIRFELATQLIVDEQYDRARAVLERLLAEDPDDWQAHSQLSIVLAFNEPDAALRHARRAVEIAPLLFDPRMNLVQALLVNRRYADAKRELERLRDMIPPGEPARGLVERQLRIVEARL